MSRTERRETLVGVLALLVAVSGLTLTALGNRVDHESEKAAATYTAEFGRTDGLHLGAPVRLSGMDIGKVGKVTLNDRYRAVLTLDLNQNVVLPDDTAALIETDGVFGSKYIELQPGGSLDTLKSGSRIGITQDSVILEELIAKIVDQAKTATKKKDQPLEQTE